MSTALIRSELPTRRGDYRRHRLPVCNATGLARYRDRHQARHAAQARTAGTTTLKVATYACPDCRGFHLEEMFPKTPIIPAPVEPVAVFTGSLPSRKRRYFLVDIENPTRGAKATAEQVAELWAILKQQAPGIAPHDHVVVGASCSVSHKYRAAIHGVNVRWVVGANAPDGADRALLAAIDLHQVAQDYDELVIISGDHAFADLARQAKRHGLSVHIVTVEHPGQRTMLSRALAAAADTRSVVRLQPRRPQPPQPAPAMSPLAPITPPHTAGRVHRRVHYAPAA